MSRWLTIIGLSLTAAYLTFLCFVFNGRFIEILLLKPNEIGDVLAGSFGPLAILWLILGFFQQGKELQQNTRALELQADELRNSVQQQRELVELTRTQVKVDLEADRREEIRLRHAARPMFELSFQKKPSGLIAHPAPDPNKCILTLVNNGSNATDIILKVSSDIELQSANEIPFLKTNTFTTLRLRKTPTPTPDHSVIELSFIDSMGSKGACEFLLLKDKSDFYTGEIQSRSTTHELH